MAAKHLGGGDRDHRPAAGALPFEHSETREVSGAGRNDCFSSFVIPTKTKRLLVPFRSASSPFLVKTNDGTVVVMPVEWRGTPISFGIVPARTRWI